MKQIKEVHKRALVIAALSLLLIGLCVTIGYAMAYEGYILDVAEQTVAFDNIEHKMEQSTFSYSDVSYVPVETSLKHAGFSFGWDTDLGMLEVLDGQNTYKLKHESNVILKNNTTVQLSMPIKLKDGVFYAPIDFFEKVLNQKMLIQGRIRQKYTDTLYFSEKKAKINETEFAIPEPVLALDGAVFVPAKEVLSAMCFHVTETENGLIAKRHGREIVLQSQNKEVLAEKGGAVQAFTCHGVLYMRDAALKKVADVSIQTDGIVANCPIGYRDLLENTVVPDTYRTTSGMYYFNGVYVAGTRAMEVLRVSDQDAVNYAGVVNILAEKLPNVTTYSILVPNSGEFYAKKDKATDHTSRIRTAYQNLDSKVVPINTVQPLIDHADEKIFFSTDHHWTQRGAYYAYRAFNDYRGVDTPALDSFKTSHIDAFVGSFAGFMAGTNGAAICRQNPDFLERFLPFTEVQGEAYSDMKLTKRVDKISVVDNRYRNYMTFIGGDRPISKFTTSNKNGKSVLIIKESYGNAFATFAVNDYETVYVLDPRKFNGFGGFNERFNLVEFYQQNPFDDLIIINYPVGMTSNLRQAILNLVQS